MKEFDLIELIRRECAHARDDVRVGIGDDGAVLTTRDGHDLVVATDTLVSGVHFPASTTPYDIGWKALAVNLSDLAAMGAEPAWATLALTLPTPDPAWVAAFAGGFAALARPHGVALVGGDTTLGPLTITVTVHGFVPRGAALLRSGARVGDLVCVTGELGDAAAALEHFDVAALRERLDRPVPRVRAGIALRGRASAAIDVSDGLLADLGRLCAASGVGARLDEAPPMSGALLQACTAAVALVHAWTGGDDYELCFTLPPESLVEVRGLPDKGVPIATLGRIVATPGVRVVDSRGNDVTPARRGYEHFA
ncbi:MAG TPA: thiamine-phosphate kinase [Candidatus Saccharimonadia bacterium]|nr:thiamine-phosphate kinase [Candidatus Saccharimonadia bacterium]